MPDKKVEQPSFIEEDEVQDQEIGDDEEQVKEADGEDPPDDEAGEPEDGCEPGEGTDRKKGAKGKPSSLAKKGTSSRPATAPAPTKAESFTYPFNVRYGAQMVDLYGLVDGQSYTEKELIEVLVQQQGFEELEAVGASFHKATATNTLVITIKGSKKGAPAGALALRIPISTLNLVEERFLITFMERGTEDRALFYHSEDRGLFPVWPDSIRRPRSVTCDVDLSFEHDGRWWDLAFDLHSHHRMGCFWSPTDHANEMLRGPIFGVCSWKNERFEWLFRRFTGAGFEDLTYEQVVDDGKR